MLEQGELDHDKVGDNLHVDAFDDHHREWKGIACIDSRFESRREKMKNIRGKSVKKSRDWIQEKKVRWSFDLMEAS